MKDARLADSPRLTDPRSAATVGRIPPLRASIESTASVRAAPRIEVAGATHVGMRRAHNEDNLLLLEEQQVYVVADGMGGHASGEVASQIAVEEMASFYLRTHRDRDATWPYRMDGSRDYEENRLAMAVRLANLRIHELAHTEQRYQKMGTTLVAMAFCGGEVLVAHVGDSRAYRLRQGVLTQLTEDHSLLNDYIRSKKLTPEEIERFPHKNVIVRALGMAEDVKVDLRREAISPGDQYLLCSDGLSGMLQDPAIAHLMGSAQNLSDAVQRLIDAANQAGGQDNVTAVVAGIY